MHWVFGSARGASVMWDRIVAKMPAWVSQLADMADLAGRLVLSALALVPIAYGTWCAVLQNFSSNQDEQLGLIILSFVGWGFGIGLLLGCWQDRSPPRVVQRSWDRVLAYFAEWLADRIEKSGIVEWIELLIPPEVLAAAERVGPEPGKVLCELLPPSVKTVYAAALRVAQKAVMLGGYALRVLAAVLGAWFLRISSLPWIAPDSLPGDRAPHLMPLFSMMMAGTGIALLYAAWGRDGPLQPVRRAIGEIVAAAGHRLSWVAATLACLLLVHVGMGLLIGPDPLIDFRRDATSQEVVLGMGLIAAALFGLSWVWTEMRK